MAKQYIVSVGRRPFQITDKKDRAIEIAKDCSALYWNTECKVCHANWNQVKGTPIFMNGMKIDLEKMTKIGEQYLFVSKNRNVLGQLHITVITFNENGLQYYLTADLFGNKDYPENCSAIYNYAVPIIEKLGIGKETPDMVRDGDEFYPVYEFDMSKLPMYTEGGEE